jgi:hypothetical protein
MKEWQLGYSEKSLSSRKCRDWQKMTFQSNSEGTNLGSSKRLPDIPWQSQNPDLAIRAVNRLINIRRHVANSAKDT